ncbi:hypothetical protein [Bradyrhizobium sp. USDA 4454]
MSRLEQVLGVEIAAELAAIWPQADAWPVRTAGNRLKVAKQADFSADSPQNAPCFV